MKEWDVQTLDIVVTRSTVHVWHLDILSVGKIRVLCREGILLGLGKRLVLEVFIVVLSFSSRTFPVALNSWKGAVHQLTKGSTGCGLYAFSFTDHEIVLKDGFFSH